MRRERADEKWWGRDCRKVKVLATNGKQKTINWEVKKWKWKRLKAQRSKSPEIKYERIWNEKERKSKIPNGEKRVKVAVPIVGVVRRALFSFVLFICLSFHHLFLEFDGLGLDRRKEDVCGEVESKQGQVRSWQQAATLPQTSQCDSALPLSGAPPRSAFVLEQAQTQTTFYHTTWLQPAS